MVSERAVRAQPLSRVTETPAQSKLCSQSYSPGGVEARRGWRMLDTVLWGPRSTGIYDPNAPVNDDLEPYASNASNIFTQVAGADRAGHSNVGDQIPTYGQMNAKGSDWVVAKLKRLCNGHIAGCSYNDW